MLKKIILSIFFSLCLPFCFAKEVTIYFKTSNAKINFIEAFFVDLNGKNIQGKVKIEENGEAILKFDVKYPHFSFISLGDSNQKIYLKPGGVYKISVDFLKKDSSVLFSEKDANINNYLERAKINLRDFRYNNKVYYEWNVKEYSIGIQKIDSVLSIEERLFFQTNNISGEDKKLLEQEAMANILSLKMSHFLAFYNPLGTNNQNVPTILQKLEKSVTFDETLLQAHSESYLLVLKFYYQILLGKKLKESLVDIKTLTVDAYLKLSYAEIKNYNIPIHFKEFMLGDLLMNCLLDKISENFDISFNDFKHDFPNSKYISMINNRYNSLKNLNGNNAFEIEGMDINNQIVKLSDFTNKIIYIDFWATWCSPCIKEFSSSIEIQKKFKGNKDIIFLFVSIDKEPTKWKSYLSNHQELTGVHINLSESEVEKIMQAYSMNGIPRYILIDKNGKIIDANAERPSSGKIEPILRNLLK